MFDTYDLAPHLQKGKNCIAAQVWYMGEHAPYAQMTVESGFIVQGQSEAEKIVNTNNTWKAYINKAYEPVVNDIRKFHTYIVVGAGDKVNAALYPWGWDQTNFDDSAWPSGAGRFGWGLDGESTVLTAGRVTHYFRRSFAFNNASTINSLTFNVLRDDGVVVYLNGAEVFRTR